MPTAGIVCTVLVVERFRGTFISPKPLSGYCRHPALLALLPSPCLLPYPFPSDFPPSTSLFITFDGTIVGSRPPLSPVSWIISSSALLIPRPIISVILFQTHGLRVNCVPKIEEEGEREAPLHLSPSSVRGYRINHPVRADG